MTRFQVFLVIFFGATALLSVLAIMRTPLRRPALAALIVSLIACAAAIWPDATTDIAQWVGITRGTDLILYCAVLTMLAGFFTFYVRLRQLRRELTLVVRHVAMLEASGLPAAGATRPLGAES